MARSWYEQYMIPSARTGGKFGAGAVSNMRAAGLSDALILAGKRKYGFTMTPSAQAMFGPDTYKGNWLTDYFGAEGGFGLTAYNRVRGLGHHPTTIGRDMYKSGLRIGGKVEAQIKKDLEQEEILKRTAEQQALDMQQAQWDKEIEAIKDVPVPYNKPAVIAGASGRFQQQGSETASRRRGKSVKTAWSRDTTGGARGFWMNVHGARPKGGAGQQGQLNIA